MSSFRFSSQRLLQAAKSYCSDLFCSEVIALCASEYAPDKINEFSSHQQFKQLELY